MPRFGSLAELDFDHFYLGVAGAGSKTIGVKRPRVIAASEIAGADFPNQVTTVHAVVLGHRALAGVVRKATPFGAGIERLHCIGRQRPKTHGRDIEHAGFVGLCAGRATNPQPKVVADNVARCHGVVDPLVAIALHVQLCAEGAFIGFPFGTRIRQAALTARKRGGFGVAFQKVLPNFGANLFQHEPDVANDRVVASHRAFGLSHVAQANPAQA